MDMNYFCDTNAFSDEAPPTRRIKTRDWMIVWDWSLSVLSIFPSLTSSSLRSDSLFSLSSVSFRHFLLPLFIPSLDLWLIGYGTVHIDKSFSVNASISQKAIFHLCSFILNLLSSIFYLSSILRSLTSSPFLTYSLLSILSSPTSHPPLFSSFLSLPRPPCEFPVRRRVGW